MFFSVKMPLRIGGKEYQPCICYSLPEVLELTVEKLCRENRAVLYEDRVYFQSGRLLDRKGKVTALTEIPKAKRKSRKS